MAETAGLVLAVIPLVVKAAGSYKQTNRDGRLLFSTTSHHELKSSLLTDLSLELELFDHHLRYLIENLPDLTDQKCSEVLESTDPRAWAADSVVVQALSSYLGQRNFDKFLDAVKVVHLCVDDLLKDEAFRRHMDVQVDAAFCINYWQGKLTSGHPSTKVKNKSIFKERLHLWWNEDDLRDRIRQVKRWRKFVAQISETAQLRQQQQPIPVARQHKPSQRPSCLVPRLSSALHHILHQKWKCGQTCPGSHAAKICLQVPESLHRNADPDQVQHKLILSTPHITAPPQRWQETTVIVTSHEKHGQVTFASAASPGASAQTCFEEIESICSTLRKHARTGGRGKLQFSVDHFEDSSPVTIQRSRNYRQRNLSFEATAQTITLADALKDSHSQLSLTQKRQLALILAYALMTFGSSWLAESWSKHDILLYYTPDNKLCIHEPFVSSDMNVHNTVHSPPGVDVVHPLPALVHLGILLLELETGKFIESMRTPEDMNGVTMQPDENTDHDAAYRTAETLTNSTTDYKEAIVACLNEQLWPVNADMYQEDVRRLIYDQIVEKIESDLEKLNAGVVGVAVK